MAASISISPPSGSSVKFYEPFTFKAKLSGGTLYADHYKEGYYYYDENYPWFYIYCYDASGNELPSGALELQETTISGNSVSASVNLSEIFSGKDMTGLARIVFSGDLEYDGAPGEGWYSIYFDGTSDGSGTKPYYTVIVYTACGAPTSCSLSSTLATGNVTLSWSGAKAGTSNAITGYEIQRCESTDGSTWGSWEALTTVSTTATSGSTSVAPPSTAGNYYKYRVRTQGAAGSSYYSSWKESTNAVRRDHAALAGFTDSTLTVGTSPVKALHMQELQSRVNTLRAFYGLAPYAFTTITAGQTGIAGWTTHVNEIRAAVDEVCTASGKTHETWISFSVNCPRADVLSQLRTVVLSI